MGWSRLQSARARLTLTVAVAVALGLGCATPPPPVDLHSAGLAARVRIRAPIRIFVKTPDHVFFVRLDDESEAQASGASQPGWPGTDTPLARTHLYPSNFSARGYFYLLNAPPGRYVAVAAFDQEQKESTKIGESIDLGGGLSIWVGTTIENWEYYTVYLSEETIRETEVQVEPGRLAFMGDFEIRTSPGLEGADAVQQHYFGLLGGGIQGDMIVRALFGHFDYRGSLGAARRGPEAHDRFQKHAASSLGESGWAGRMAPAAIAEGH